MAELFGTIASGAGLYISCCEIFKQIQSVRQFHQDTEIQVGLLELQAYRVVKWGEYRRIGESPSSRAAPVVDQREERHLQRLLSLFEEVRKIFDEYGIQYDTSLASLSTSVLPTTDQLAQDSRPVTRKKFFRKLTIPFRKIEWAATGKEKLFSHCETIRNYVDGMHSVWPVSGSNLPRVEHGNWITTKLAELLDDTLRSQKLHELTLLEHWLDLDTSKYNPHQDLEDFLKKLEPGSCQWIFKTAEYKTWVDDSDSSPSIIWINGSSGYGKTLLCANIVNDLSKSSNHLAFFFSSSHAQSGGRIDYVLRFWILQLAETDMNIRKAILSETSKSRATNNDVWSLLRIILSMPDPVTFIVDGLDEYHRNRQHELNEEFLLLQRNFLKKLRQEISTVDYKARLMVVSRPITEIKAVISKCDQDKVLNYCITRDDVLPDIQSLSRKFIKTTFQKLSIEDHEELIDSMVKTSEGSFLWIDSVKKHLKPNLRKGLLQRTIKQVPVDLTQRYRGQLSSLSNQNPARALDILSWVLLAKQPMSVWEICQVLAIQTENDEKYVDQDLFPEPLDDDFIERDILRYCGELIVMQDKADDPGNSWQGLSLLRPAHPSVADFLLPLLSPTSEPTWNQQVFSNIKTKCSVQLDIAEKCLAYLMDSDIELDLIVERPSAHAARLKDYALRFWHVHLAEAPDREEFPLDLLSKFFQADSDAFRYWTLEIETSVRQDEDNELEAGTPLYYAVLLGHSGLINEILQKDPMQVNLISGTYGTPTVVALVYRRLEIFKKLLEAGADPQFGFGYLLLKAAEVGSLEFVETLIRHAKNVNTVLDVNFQDVDGITPLILAASRGHVEIVKLLLSLPGIQIDLVSQPNCYALTLAVESRHIKVVELLMTFGADTTIPFLFSCSGGDRRIFEILLKPTISADRLNFQAEGGISAISIAASHGHYQLVESLLKHGADTEIADALGLTPLCMTCVFNEVETAQVLLKHGSCNVNHVVNITGPKLEAEEFLGSNHSGSTPLILAAAHGQSEIMSALLEMNGIDINVENDERKSALYYCASNGLHEMLVKIIKLGGRSSISKTWQETPLYAAVRNGHDIVVKELLKQNFDAELDSESKDSILAVSISYSWPRIFELLAKRWPEKLITKVDLLRSAPRRDGGLSNKISGRNEWLKHSNILQSVLGVFTQLEDESLGSRNSILLNTAARCGNEQELRKVLQRLNDAGVLQDYIDQVDDYGATALWNAAYENHIEVVEILLFFGANATKPRHNGCTPLIGAASNGNTAIVSKLVTHLKAINQLQSINHSDGLGTTALHYAVARNHIGVLRVLLDNKADATRPAQNGTTPLLVASYHGKLEMVETLLLHLKNCDRLKSIDDTDTAGSTSLWIAVYKSHSAVVRLLLEYGAEMRNSRFEGLTPINAAVLRGDIEMVRILLEQPEVDVAIACRFGRTPMHNAAYRTNWKILELLVAKDPKLISCYDYSNNTPLLAAAAAGQFRNVNILLEESSLQLLARNAHKKTALHLSSLSGSVAITKSVLKAIKHVDQSSQTDLLSLNDADSSGKTPLSLAGDRKHPHVVCALLKEELIETDSSCECGRTALHFAAISGDTLSAWVLLRSNKSLLNRLDSYGSTPLSLAARHHRRGVVYLLTGMPEVEYKHKDCFGFDAIDWMRHTGLSIDGEFQHDPSKSLRWVFRRSMRSKALGSRFSCDICTLNIADNETRYHCSICLGGDFDICAQCFKRGAHCQYDLHKLEAIDQEDKGDQQLAEIGSHQCWDREKMLN